jgi:recombinational DNA repair protein RecT
MESARVGLMPDNREAAIIPYKGRAELQPMVQGITRLMLRSPGLTKVEARAVFEGDDFDFWYGLKPDLQHKPKFQSEAVTHAYAIMWRQGADPTFEVVGREEIERARLTSRAPDSPAWAKWYSEMARKVAVKRLGKYADLSPEATRAIDLDNLVSGDPWAGHEPESVSPEYRNQLVRSRTEAGIDRLKQRMAVEEPQRHPPLEVEVSQVPPGPEMAQARPAGGGEQPEPAAEGGPDDRKFTPELLDAIVKDGLAPNRSAAAAVLGRSPWRSTSVSTSNRKPILHWVRAYNGYLDGGAPEDEAAAAANAFLGDLAPKPQGGGDG